mmetsp:Transcript_98167/g.282362  ORF Transcript_98167/g.282362 Transcript_98167/m.282362 type:complete len:201 (+) Transcript_98167:180-782(+)
MDRTTVLSRRRPRSFGGMRRPRSRQCFFKVSLIRSSTSHDMFANGVWSTMTSGFITKARAKDNNLRSVPEMASIKSPAGALLSGVSDPSAGKCFAKRDKPNSPRMSLMRSTWAASQSMRPTLRFSSKDRRSKNKVSAWTKSTLKCGGTIIFPLEGKMLWAKSRSNVVLPARWGPCTDTIVPCGIAKFTPRSTQGLSDASG